MKRFRTELFIHPENIRSRDTAIKYAKGFAEGVEKYKPFVKCPMVTNLPFEFLEREFNIFVMRLNYLTQEWKLKPEEIYEA